MKSSSIHTPEKEPLIIIHQWQVDFCNGNQCAAALLSFFTYWHDIKLNMRDKNIKENEIRERNGDSSKLSTTLHQFHSEEELEEGIMGIWKRDSIRKGIKELEDIGVLQITKNPNPKYAFDKTRYFILIPEVANEYLIERKFGDAKPKNQSRLSENPSPSSENQSTITETTQEITYRKDIYFLFTFNSLETDADVREAFAETDDEVKKKGVIQLLENEEQDKLGLWVTLPKKKPFALVSRQRITKLSFEVAKVSEDALESFSKDEDVYNYFRPLSDHRLNAALEESRKLGMGESKPMTDDDMKRIFNL